MNDMLENKIRTHAETIFGCELKAGHRERFAGKLAAKRNRRPVPVRIITVCTTAAAAIAAAVFLLTTFVRPVDDRDDESFDDVRNYYNMLLEDEIESTEQILLTIDNRYREEIRQDIEFIRSETSFMESGEQNKVLLVNIYSSKIEALQHIRNILSKQFIHNLKTEQI
ncbi:MAG: hypothetical protein LBS42_10340 [Tannerella sp.]|jgi:hypothetical protein|nr:hypothetical protein [Tannerella sp.]